MTTSPIPPQTMLEWLEFSMEEINKLGMTSMLDDDLPMLTAIRDFIRLHAEDKRYWEGYKEGTDAGSYSDE